MSWIIFGMPDASPCSLAMMIGYMNGKASMFTVSGWPVSSVVSTTIGVGRVG